MPFTDVRPVADGLDYHVAVQSPLRALDWFGTAPAGGVGRPQPGAHEREALEPLAPADDIACRLVEQQEMHARRQRFHALVGLGRHLGVGAPVDQVDVRGAEPGGRLDAVHGHRPAADDGHGPAGDPFGHILETAVAQRRKVVHRGKNTRYGLSLRVDGLRRPQAGRQKDGFEALLEQLLRSARTRDGLAALELDAEIRDVLELPSQEIQAEAVGDHPVAQHAAGLGPGLENGDRVTLLGELGRAAQSGRAGAHHGDPGAAGSARL
ncbi:MAG TPA: hypothetical protein VN300_11375 [Desulfobacterales bacterium]|nr:hypothetical protein [Desulfobacterales bacterium]